MGCHHHMAVGLLWQQVHFFFCRFLLCFKANRKEEWDALHAPVEVGLPPKVLQGTGVRRKQQSKRGEKINEQG